MPDPITPEDLYGPSSPPVPEGVTPRASAAVPPLPVEETPEIIIDNQPSPPPPSVPPPPHQPKSSLGSMLGALILFIGLFGLGVWLSSYIRQYLPDGLGGVTPEKQGVVRMPTPTPIPQDPYADWKTYQVISSTTKLPVEGVSFKLPPDILAPSCDTTTCMSQGTYLSGGTRFTVAPRGTGQALVDFRGSAISDVGGTVFTSQSTTAAGHTAQLFTGTFSGRTVAGYGFSEMRGYMIEVAPTLSLEINHFTPVGVTTDFVGDDALFEQIVGSLVLPGITPVITLPVSATTSGF